MTAITADSIRKIVGDDQFRPATPDDVVDDVPAQFVVEPTSPDQLASILKIANDAKLHVIPRGGGTKIGWGNPPRQLELIVSTGRLNRVVEHADCDMTATVQAGCTVADFQTALAMHKQRLALDPLWPTRATIGGILATNDSGPLRAAYGTLRDHLIGITVVLPDGTIAKSGGKVVKNVAGYDLPKLFTGSLGTLGIITEATFRLYSIAHATRTLRFVADRTDALGAVISAMRECSMAYSAMQFEIENDRPPAVLILIEGHPGAIDEKIDRVNQAAQNCRLEPIEIPADAWRSRERLFDEPEMCIVKFSLLPTDLPNFLKRVSDTKSRWTIIAQTVGVGLLAMPFAQIPKIGYPLTFLRCPPDTKKKIDVWPDTGNALAMMRRIKQQFDPHGILSPGRFVGGI